MPKNLEAAMRRFGEIDLANVGDVGHVGTIQARLKRSAPQLVERLPRHGK